MDWGVAAKTPLGESESGDRHLVKSIGHRVLVAVVDGLGRGPEAAAAARAAIDALERHDDASVPDLFATSHRALVGTRGAVLSLAVVDPQAGSLTWAGVGNVLGILRQRGQAAVRGLATRGGIVGAELPRIEPATLALSGDDTLIFATDGVRVGFVDGLSGPSDDPKRQAADLLARFGRENDDALVLVAHFGGARSP
jgi:phosphoserine phosphatase RsbX